MDHKQWVLAAAILIPCFTGIAWGETDSAPVTGRWRGFNNPGMYVLEWSNRGFDEAWFQTVHEFGFNYARLPLDYRTYTREGDWSSFDEEKLKNIDDAVRWGRKHCVHVSLNLHRAPGYCVHDWNGPASWARIPDNQKKNLWTDKSAQKAFVAHWRMFAKRYKDVPNEWLSFNLLNEPGSTVSVKDYAGLMGKAIQAIRKVTPDRLVIVDGMDAGAALPDELLGLDAMLSKHSYDPRNICN
jgi:endoglucanase